MCSVIQANSQNGVYTYVNVYIYIHLYTCIYIYTLPRTSVASFILSGSFVYLQQRMYVSYIVLPFLWFLFALNLAHLPAALFYTSTFVGKTLSYKTMFLLNDKTSDDVCHPYIQLLR